MHAYENLNFPDIFDNAKKNMVSSDSTNYADDSAKYIQQVRDFLSHARIETLRDAINILESSPAVLDYSDSYC